MCVGVKVVTIYVEGRRRKEISKRRWMDGENVDLRAKGLSVEGTQNRAVWRQLVRNMDPEIEVHIEEVHAG